jgi:hypothetical protein
MGFDMTAEVITCPMEYEKGRRMKRAALPVVAIILLLAGCGEAKRSGAQGNSALLPTPGGRHSTLHPAVAGAHESGLLGVTMPEGATLTDSAEADFQRVETWSVPGSADQVVAAMRARLPIGATLQGYQWCNQSAFGTRGVLWGWHKNDDILGVGAQGNTVIASLTFGRGKVPVCA